MTNHTLKEINRNNWFITFQWQMEDGKLCVLFRRAREPSFIVFASGHDENRMYGEAQVKIAHLEGFIKEKNIENEWIEYLQKFEERFKNLCKLG